MGGLLELGMGLVMELELVSELRLIGKGMVRLAGNGNFPPNFLEFWHQTGFGAKLPCSMAEKGA